MNASRSITAVIGLALLASGCASSPEEQPTITLEEAEQRVEGHFRAALAALPEEARPEPALIESYDRPRSERLLAYHEEGYQMSLQYEGGKLLLFTISPCVFPDGTPE